MLNFHTYGVDNTARILSTDQDVYVYEFAWDEEPEPLDFLIGAGHGMDIPFAFGNFKTDRNSVARFAWSQANREAREELSEVIMTFYAQFASTGDPNPPDSDLPQWTPWSNDRGVPKRIIFDTDGPYMSIE